MRPQQFLLVVALVGLLVTAGAIGFSRTPVSVSNSHHAAISLAGAVPGGSVKTQKATPAYTANNMGVLGLAPEMTSISWPISSPGVGYGFSHYELDYSYDNVNWYVYKNITSQSTTSLGYTWCPGCALWWNEFTIDSSPVGGYIESSGSLSDLVQPSNATTSFVWNNDTSAWIDWSNPSIYGGNVSYVSYELWESVNGSAYGLDSSIYNVSQLSELVSGLTPDTEYSFFVRTWDSLSDTSVGGLYETNSTATTFTTPFPFSATAGVNRSTADVGQSLAFECGVNGGLAPYNYQWAFGDGGTALGSTASYSYATPGAYTPTCAAFDHADSVATGQVAVTISATPTVAAPTSSPASNVSEGKSVTFNVSATAGSGGLSYSWSGLPPGCTSTNASSLTCDPTGSGTFSIVVTVTDSNGGSAQSAPLSFTVKPTVLGLSPTEGYWLVGGIVAAVVAAALATVLVLRRRKKGSSPPPEPSTISPNPLGPPTEAPPSPPAGGPPPGTPP